MLGSIGYNYGYNRVKSQHSSEEIFYGPQELLSACPCRSTFPRGFLWDEGFHHLVFRKFDPELSLKVDCFSDFLLTLLSHFVFHFQIEMFSFK